MYELIIISSCNACISLTVNRFIVLNSGEVCSLYLLCVIIHIVFFKLIYSFTLKPPYCQAVIYLWHK